MTLKIVYCGYLFLSYTFIVAGFSPSGSPTSDWPQILQNDSTKVADVTCDMYTVREANSRQLHVILQDLMNTAYFRLFRVPGDGECPLTKKTQEVPLEKEPESCGATFGNDFGPLFSNGLFGEELSVLENTEGKAKCDLENEGFLDLSITLQENVALDSSYSKKDCDNANSPDFWLNICDNLDGEDNEKESFVNLQKNIEHYTGYNGTKIWKAIYDENCFEGIDSNHSDMCLEERVLYRLTSGLHASINTHIALNFFDKPNGFLPNPERFVQAVASYPERVGNMYFTFAFLLRALKKAEPVLFKTDFTMGESLEEYQILSLLKHLLASDALDSCKSLFQAFDETMLFQSDFAENDAILKRNFKRAFMNITSLFNCVKCQKCKLHGKMQLRGIGTALKILLLPEENIQLTRDEIVPLINTLGKLSESIEAIPKLIELYWKNKSPETEVSTPQSTNPLKILASSNEFLEADTLVQDTVIDAILQNDEVFASLYDLVASPVSNDLFVRQMLRLYGTTDTSVVIIGGGLSGLTAALTLLDRGANQVTVVEQNSFVGGNSARASSGINAISNLDDLDEIALYVNDTVKSYFSGATPNWDDNKEAISRIQRFVEGSHEALAFVRDRLGMELDMPGRLGGHSVPRTYRPKVGLAGAEMISKIAKELKSYESTGHLKVLKNTIASELNFEGNKVNAVSIRDKVSGDTQVLKASQVIISTGGFAYVSETNAWLEQIRPDVFRFKSTNGNHATGSGLSLVKDIAQFVDLEDVQVHPTAFVSHGASEAKLCAEILRGVGGILLTEKGVRFVNELEKRDYVTDKMVHNPSKRFWILLNEKSAMEIPSHISLYTKGNHLTQVHSVQELANFMGIHESNLLDTFESYSKGIDVFGRENKPFKEYFINSDSFYVGEIAPAVHYTMGGIRVDENMQVMKQDSTAIENLYAVGETVGGLHGKNRLGGNALTECVVAGIQVGKHIPVSSKRREAAVTKKVSPSAKIADMSEEEFVSNSDEASCWVVLGAEGYVYDLTSFAADHPAGPEPIHKLCGKDGSEDFEDVHSYELLENYDFKPIGKLKI